ncbi:MAG: VIT1/CCC1 transporter family protein [Mycobacteriales bacterium]
MADGPSGTRVRRAGAWAARPLLGRGHDTPTWPVPLTEPGGLGEAAAREGARVARRGAIREVVFGAQDGLTSNLALVAGVSGAAVSRSTVLVAGLAGLVGGAISMAVGAYISTKSQRDVFAYELAQEREQLRSHFYVERIELAEILMREGLEADAAHRASEALSTNEAVMLKTMAEKELGIPYAPAGSPLTDAGVMGVSFAVGAGVPLAAYLALAGGLALVTAIVATLAALFLIGVAKAVLAGENPWRSGAEIAVLAGAGTALAYGLGHVLPGLLGVHATKGG